MQLGTLQLMLEDRLLSDLAILSPGIYHIIIINYNASCLPAHQETLKFLSLSGIKARTCIHYPVTLS